MDLNVFKFENSYESRYEEYSKIFTTFKLEEEFATPEDIKSIWCLYLQTKLEPIGWTALWKPCRDFCFKFNALFPTVLVIMVEDVNFEELTAEVTIVNIGNNVVNTLPNKVFDVELKQLYPTIGQEHIALNIETTAKVIDQLRFFYQHLWLSWDLDDEHKGDDWVTDHLGNRLKLYYEIMEKEISEISIAHYRNLVASNFKIASIIEELERNCTAEELAEENKKIGWHLGDVENDGEEEFQSEHDEKIFKLSKYFGDIQIIKYKINCWENPEYRIMQDAVLLELSNSVSAILVNPPCLLEESIQYSNQMISTLSPSICIKEIHENLQDAVSQCYKNETIVVAPGIHYLSNIGNLASGGNLKGLRRGEERAEIIDVDIQWGLFEFFGNETCIDDVLINVDCCKDVMIIRNSRVTLNNVCMKNQSFDKIQAIIVLGKEGCLTACHCTFDAFEVAIVTLPGATVCLSDCVFKNNRIDIRVLGNAIVKTDNECRTEVGTKMNIKYEDAKLYSEILNLCQN